MIHFKWNYVYWSTHWPKTVHYSDNIVHHGLNSLKTIETGLLRDHCLTNEPLWFLVGLKFGKEKPNLLKNIWWGEIRLISSPKAAIYTVSSCLSNVIHLFTILNRSNCSHMQTCINDILAATDCQKCLCEVISDPFLCPTAAPWFLIICPIKITKDPLLPIMM